MISYPYISTLFKSILAKSKSIGGRFYVCPKMGYEINSDMVGEVLKQINTPKKYPLSLLMPPRMVGTYGLGIADWNKYMITMFFLKTSYYGDGNVLSPYTNTSTNPIPEDWAEMQVSAVSFLNVLKKLQEDNLHQLFRVGTREIPLQPVSEMGIDRASGVRIDFEFMLPYGCEEFEDYEVNDIELIEIPEV